MATLLLSAVGTLIGGPLGGAIGALAGRSIDGAIIGSGKREGARLRELAVTTSSYGQPISRHHGRMRAAGTIIWATDLVEHKDKSGGKKGQPSITTYAYSTSFAVALSSRPILDVRRIWADGNLLRGEAGDLKTAGAIRIHTGRGDQAPDPLIAADKGDACPAFRDCAYVVFEDLALGDFGNRIPALTFEVVADEGEIALADLIGPVAPAATSKAGLGPLAGYANEGGPLAGTLETIGTLFPLAIDAGGDRLTIAAPRTSADEPIMLPAPVRAWEEADFGASGGRRQERDAGAPDRIEALRYYDIARDFQPGVQRPAGRVSMSNENGAVRTIEFPGAFVADDARALADAAARRDGWRRETLQWRIAELDPALSPGAEVRVPGKSGVWRVEGWEWRERGIELALVRRNPGAVAMTSGDAGTAQPPIDRILGPTTLRVIELPPASSDPAAPVTFAAASGTGAWNGAALYVDRAGELVPIGSTVRTSATIGRLAQPLTPSPALLFEPEAAIEVDLEPGGGAFVSAPLASLLMGANRLLVGGEVIQFASAAQIGPLRWRLSGLLRGRGGTEAAALSGHPSATDVVLIDDALTRLDSTLDSDGEQNLFAAIGLADREPVYATRMNTGLGSKPLCPVHPRCSEQVDGGLSFSWVRRARGAWVWQDGVDVPLGEETELYRVGYGPVGSPVALWDSVAPGFLLDGPTRSVLANAIPGGALWVRQVGRFAQSDPVLLARIA